MTDLLKQFKLALSELNEILLKHYEIFPFATLERVLELIKSMKKHLNIHNQELIGKELIEIRDKLRLL